MKEPATPPQLPDDPLPDRIRDHFPERYSGNISPEDATWLAGLIADFISSNRLIPENDYRLAARKCVRILVAIDQSMVEARNAARQWLTISLALGLPSSCWTNLTEAALARQCGISKMAISKQMHKFLESVDMEPAFGTGRYPQFKSFIQ
jgi:hypothetical protein